MTAAKYLLVFLILLITLPVYAQKPYDGPVPTYIQKEKSWIYRDRDGNQVFDGRFDDAWFFYEGLAAVKQHGTFKYIDLGGKTVISNMYSQAGDFSEGRAVVKLPNTGYFYINRSGDVLSRNDYTFLSQFKNGIGTGIRDGVFYLIDAAGKELPGEFNYIGSFNEGLAYFSRDLKFGFVNTRGEAQIKPLYLSANDFLEGYAWVKKTDTTECLIDRNGKEITQAKRYVNGNHLPYQTKYLIESDKKGSTVNTRDGKTLFKTKLKITRWIKAGLFVFKDDQTDSEGVVDSKGKEVIKAEWKSINPGEGDFLIVQKGMKYGITGLNGKELIPAKYDFYWNTPIGTFLKEGKFFSLYNEKENSLGKKKYDNLWFPATQNSVPAGFAQVKVWDDRFFIDASGKEYFDRSVTLLTEKGPNGKYGFKDLETGEWYGETAYDKIETESEGMYPVVKSGKYGFFSKHILKQVIPCMYDEISFFKEGLCAVRLAGLWGYINNKGETEIPFKFRKAWQFIEGKAEVELENGKYVINRKGEIIDDITPNKQYDPWADRPQFSGNTLTGSYELEFYHMINSPLSNPKKGQKSQELEYPVRIKVTRDHISTDNYYFTVEGSGNFNGQRVYNLRRDTGNNTYLSFVFFGPGEDKCAFMTRDGMVVYATSPMQFGK